MSTAISGSPHIKSRVTTRRIMLDVLLALLPALLAGILNFGLRALMITLICAGTAVLTEWICSLIITRCLTVSDCSAAVTGVLLALTLPVSISWWAAALGSVFAVLMVKILCGGLGQNVFNPALAARAFLMLLFPAQLVRYTARGAALPLLASAADAVTAATPLHDMQKPALPQTGLLNAFLGMEAGSIGETSALALLLGGAYLVYRRVISVRIPLAYLGTAAVLTLVFFKTEQPVQWMLYSLFSGGIVLGAVFMATDYTTSPVTPKGQLLYGAGCGALTVLFRYFGLFPEGVTYAILLMNACAWILDRWTPPRRFGARKGEAV